MTITFPLSFPTITGISSINLRAKSSVAVSSSPFTFEQQAQIHQGRIWEADISLPSMKRDNAEEWISFLLKLNGAEGTFLMGDPNGATARGSASGTPGTPVVMGADQSGGTLTIDGLPAGATDYLKVGDYIQIGLGVSTQLYKNLNDVSSDSNGELTLDIWPDLRSSPANGVDVFVDSTVGHFRLAGNIASWSIDVATFYGIDFSAIEAL